LRHTNPLDPGPRMTPPRLVDGPVKYRLGSWIPGFHEGAEL
jgi:hypothetical protein